MTSNNAILTAALSLGLALSAIHAQAQINLTPPSATGQRSLVRPLATPPRPAPAPVDEAEVRRRLSAVNGPMPRDKAALDALVAKEDWAGLNKRLTGSRSVEDLDWEKDKVVNGGNVLMAMHYVNTLWTVSSVVKSPEREVLRDTAVAYAFYDLGVATVDGARCQDPSAAGHRLDQFMTMWRPIFAHGQTMSDQAKDAARFLAPKLEWATAPVRANDPVLCADGAEQIRAGIEAGTTKEVATPPGGFGKTYEVTKPAGFKVGYLPEEQWKPEAEKRRATIPAMIDALLAKAETEAGAAPGP